MQGVMGDLVFVVLVLAFFALAFLVIRGCEAIVGRDSHGESAE